MAIFPVPPGTLCTSGAACGVQLEGRGMPEVRSWLLVIGEATSSSSSASADADCGGVAAARDPVTGFGASRGKSEMGDGLGSTRESTAYLARGY